MGQAQREKDQLRRAKIRLRRIQHYEQNNQERQPNVPLLQDLPPANSIRGIRRVASHGLKAQKCGPRKHPLATPAHIVALVLHFPP